MGIKSSCAPRRTTIAAAVAAAAVLAPIQDVHSAAGLDPLPHYAVYDLSLETAGSNSGIIGVSGRMVLEWADACEGYTTTQQIRMRIERAEGRLIDSDFAIASWEVQGRQHVPVQDSQYRRW